jgi:hypothetical protein
MIKKAQHIRKAKGAKPRVFPAHLATTPEDWRALKQQEWREVLAALQRYQYGSAYVPAQAELWKLHQLVEAITKQIEPPDWVAW